VICSSEDSRTEPDAAHKEIYLEALTRGDLTGGCMRAAICRTERFRAWSGGFYLSSTL